MENTIDFKKKSPQSGHDDKHSAQNPKIAPVSEGKGKGPLAAAATAADAKKEALPADAALPAAEKTEKRNARGGQKARKRAREAAAGEGSGERDNLQGGGGAAGYQLPLEEPMKLTTCPWEGCGSVFDNKRALYLHLSLHIRRPWLKWASSSSSSSSIPLDAGAAAPDEGPKAGQAGIDLNLKQYLVPDLNLQPPEYFRQEAQD